MKINFVYLNLIFTILVLFFLSCSTTQNVGTDEEIVKPPDKFSAKNFVSTEPVKYDKFLVSMTAYTTDGASYHKKYQNQLQGIAEILSEKMKMNVKESSIGFYYDKIEKNKNKLFLGIDVICADSDYLPGQSYEENGRNMMRIYLKNVLDVLINYQEILGEENVEGLVVGLHWGSGNSFINIWMPKQKVINLYNDRTTFKELVIESTVTNYEGKNIRLTL